MVLFLRKTCVPAQTWGSNFCITVLVKRQGSSVIQTFLTCVEDSLIVSCLTLKVKGPGTVVYIFNPSTLEAEAGDLSSRPSWSTEPIPGQPEIHRETDPWKTSMVQDKSQVFGSFGCGRQREPQRESEKRREGESLSSWFPCVFSLWYLSSPKNRATVSVEREWSQLWLSPVLLSFP